LVSKYKISVRTNYTPLTFDDGLTQLLNTYYSLGLYKKDRVRAVRLAKGKGERSYKLYPNTHESLIFFKAAVDKRYKGSPLS